VRARLAAIVLCAPLAGGAACSSSESDDGASAKTGTERDRAATPAERPNERATSSATRARLLRVATFSEPTYLASPPGDRNRRFVTEREGRIRIIRGRTKLRTPFLDIAGQVQTGGESGLLSIAFHPDFARNRRYFVYYTDNAGALCVDSYLASASDPNRTEPGSRRRIIRQPHRRFNHKGGQLQFGRDGKLYFGFGDGGGGGDPDENAQNPGRPLGKLLRVEPRADGGYDVPRDNPFVGRGGARPEVFAYGLRNPYRFSFDRRTGDLTIGDVGQDEVEEIDFLRASRRARRPRGGVNFGWDVFEGRRRFESGRAPGHVPPVIQRRHSQGSCSITGGYVIRDRSLGSLYGAYVYGDLCDPRLRVARLRSGRARGDRALGPRLSQVVSFGEDGRGRVHVVSLDGGVYRLARRG
jgi:glucose/arabinose dehydrogenase